ncbi:MAG: glycosyltransferase [Planctomycetes bacterium]|nr:glycosyltransferase [Planctomycetota bacterium]
MKRNIRPLEPLDQRGPLRVMFMVTSMPVGGAETLLVNLIERLDRQRFLPELACLKQPGPLAEQLESQIPVFSRLTSGKFDPRVLPRLTNLLRRRKIDAVVTVGAGDKMFWGRIAAARAGVPAIVAALHSTGWPDSIGRLNRRLTGLTDAFVAVADDHARHLIEVERFPADRVRMIPNGVDVEVFSPLPPDETFLRELGLRPGDPVVSIVAALRPEKNHEMFLRAAAIVRRDVPSAQFLIVGDGPKRAELEALSAQLDLTDAVHFLGCRGDVPKILSASNVVALTSHVEASPVSILEAMACSRPVVSTRVGSVAASVRDGETGYLVEPDDAGALATRLVELLRAPETASRMGRAGRQHVIATSSLEQMVAGYEALLGELYCRRRLRQRQTAKAE